MAVRHVPAVRRQRPHTNLTGSVELHPPDGQQPKRDVPQPLGSLLPGLHRPRDHHEERLDNGQRRRCDSSGCPPMLGSVSSRRTSGFQLRPCHQGSAWCWKRSLHCWQQQTKVSNNNFAFTKNEFGLLQ